MYVPYMQWALGEDKTIANKYAIESTVGGG